MSTLKKLPTMISDERTLLCISCSTVLTHVAVLDTAGALCRRPVKNFLTLGKIRDPFINKDSAPRETVFYAAHLCGTSLPSRSISLLLFNPCAILPLGVTFLFYRLLLLEATQDAGRHTALGRSLKSKNVSDPT